MDDVAIPHAAEALVGTQAPSASWYRFFEGVQGFINTLQRNTTAGLATKPGKSQVVSASWTFQFPEDGTVVLLLGSGFEWTITGTRTITAAGTSTVTLNVDGDGLEANAASTSLDEQEQNAEVAATDVLSVTFADTSGDCERLCLPVEGTRVLD